MIETMLVLLLVLALSMTSFALLYKKESNKIKRQPSEQKQEPKTLTPSKTVRKSRLNPTIVPRISITYEGAQYHYVLFIPDRDVVRFMCVTGLWYFLDRHLQRHERVLVVSPTRSPALTEHPKVMQMEFVSSLPGNHETTFRQHMQRNMAYYFKQYPTWHLVDTAWNHGEPYVVLDMTCPAVRPYVEKVAEQLPKHVAQVRVDLKQHLFYDVVARVNGAKLCITCSESEDVFCLSTQARIGTLCLGTSDPSQHINNLILFPESFFYVEPREFSAELCVRFAQQFYP